jgi:ligand-binding sensor domain-containing protein
MRDSDIKKTESQIAQYVTSVFEDSKGHLWFGTLEKGIAKFDGKKLNYLTTKDGLSSDRASGIVEDSDGIYWLMTGEGVSKYDGKNFAKLLVGEDFLSNMVSNLFIDSKGVFWIGTWNGVYTFDGESFLPFPIPFPKVSTKINEDTKGWITEIEEDSEGNIWFGRDGYGACKYDGESFTHILKKDGLHSNNVTGIEIDKEGDIWFGTRVAEKDNPDPTKRFGKGGINKLVNNEIISFPEIEGFNNSDVYGMYKDNSGNIWISTIKNGVYKYGGKEFKNYDIPISIMGMIEDQKGNLWLGGAGGLYRMNEDGGVVNVRTNGPWE